MKIGFDNEKYLKIQSEGSGSASSAASFTWSLAASCLMTSTLPGSFRAFTRTPRSRCCES